MIVFLYTSESFQVATGQESEDTHSSRIVIHLAMKKKTYRLITVCPTCSFSHSYFWHLVTNTTETLDGGMGVGREADELATARRPRTGWTT